MAKHLETGRKGEEKAVRFLTGIGYEILETNWKTQYGEIDIIARDGDLIVIIEVKTKKNILFGNPEEAVDKRKQNKLLRLAEHYIRKNNINLDIRFDVVGVILEEKTVRITHHVNAFSAFD